jgi:hypothetical protein
MGQYDSNERCGPWDIFFEKILLYILQMIVFSMCAKEAEFEEIYACERSSTMCDLIGKILTANQCDSNITVIGKNSTELVMGRDFLERYSVL